MMNKLKELFKQTIESRNVFVHEPSGLKIGVLGDNLLPDSCVKVKDHPPIQVLQHVYVASHRWEDITDHRIERFEDLDQLLQICTESRSKEDMVVISTQALDALKELVIE